MKNSYRIVVLCLMAVFVVLVTCKKQEKQVLRFATNPEYPPFCFKTGENIDGIDAAIAKGIADEMGMEYQLVAMEFEQLFPALASNKIDAAISAITITPERAQKYDFSKAYFTTNQVIIAKQDSPLVIKEERELGNYIVGSLTGTTGHAYLEEHLLQKDLMPKSNLKLFSTNLEAIGELLAGKLDFVIIDQTAAHGYSSQKPIKQAFIIETNEQYGIAMQKGKALNEKINKALDKMIESGELKKIIDSFMK